jgi:hypothetical protein
MHGVQHRPWGKSKPSSHHFPYMSQVIKSLARHSTPTLTLGVYAHVGLFDQTSALDALPSTAPTAPSTEAEILSPTGTDP